MQAQLTIDNVDTEPMDASHTGSNPTQRIFYVEPGVMELRPSPKGMEMFAYIMILAGIASGLGIWYLTDFESKKRFALFALAWFVTGAIGTLGACILNRILGTRVRFDRNTKTVKISGARFYPATIFEIDKIIGIQLLYTGKKIVGENSFPIKMYQLNFLIDGENIERFHLLQCGKQRKMQTIAKESAEFLNVPLFEQDSSILQKSDPPAQG